MIWIPKSRKELKAHLRDPLFKNAYFLMLSSTTSAGSGFFFWLIAARFYSPEEVGLASAIISAMGLISMLSLLGFDISLVRFLPERDDKAEFINTCLTISFIASMIFIFIFIAGIDIWSPSLSIIKENEIFLILFVFFTLIGPLGTLQRVGVFVGFRKTKYSSISAIVSFARVGVVPFLAAFGALGIYASMGLTFLFAFFVGVFLTSRIISYKPSPTIKKDIVNDILHFSSGNYFANIFEKLPNFVLPILVINLLGSEMNAYFFIAWTLSGVLSRMPSIAISKSLLAEGSSKTGNLHKDGKRAAKFIFLFIGFITVGVLLFGEYLLRVFGEQYARISLELLVILVLASLPFAFNSFYAHIKRVQKEIKPVIWVYGGITIITLSSSYMLVKVVGITGVGISWGIGNILIALGLGIMHRRAIFQSFT